MTSITKQRGITRRRLLELAVFSIGSLVTAVLAAPLVAYIVSPALKQKRTTWVSIARATDIPMGKPTYVEYEEKVQDGWTARLTRRSAWVATQDGKDFTVFDPHCTHLGCPYTWTDKPWEKEGPYKGQPHFHCPCHEGIYTADGTVISGPPPRPLDRLETKVVDGVVMVGGLTKAVA